MVEQQRGKVGEAVGYSDAGFREKWAKTDSVERNLGEKIRQVFSSGQVAFTVSKWWS